MAKDKEKDPEEGGEENWGKQILDKLEEMAENFKQDQPPAEQKKEVEIPVPQPPQPEPTPEPIPEPTPEPTPQPQKKKGLLDWLL